MQVYDLEKRLLPVVLGMEEIGMKIDLSLLHVLSREITTEIEKLREEIFRLAGCEFDLNSPRKVAAILYDRLGLKCEKRTKNGQLSTDKDSLKALCGYNPSPQIDPHQPCLREKDLGTFVEPVKITLDQHLDQWLETAAKCRLSERTFTDYEET